MSIFSNFLHNLTGDIGRDMTNPSAAAQGYLEKIPGVEKQYLDPYIQRGEAAYKQFSPILGQMAQDPSGYMSHLMQGYIQSPEYQQQLHEALRSAGNTAAAGGMRGSIQDIDQAANITQSLQGQDMQRWLQNVMGTQMTGLSGLGHLYDQGYGASGSLASDLANVLGQQGQYAFQGAREMNQRRADESAGAQGLFGSILGGVSSVLPFFL